MDKEKVSVKIPGFLKDKRFQVGLVILLFFAVLFVGVQIRTEPIRNGNLIDETTGDYTPLALDPYYFLRVSETLLENGGELPAFDPIRDPTKNVPWTDELLPHSTVWVYKTLKLFDPDTTLNYADILNPVAFFVLGLIAFFSLVWVLTKNKWVAIASSSILAVIPPYLYRTLAGFSDHEAIGMFGFFAALLTFVIGMFYLEKDKLKYSNSTIFGIIAGFSAMLSIASWGGIAKFLFMILPLAFLIQWFANGKKNNWNQIIFYASFILGVFIFIPIFGFDLSEILRKYMLNTTGLLTFFTLGYTSLELFFRRDKRIPQKIKDAPNLMALSTIILVGAIGYHAFVGNIFSMIYNVIHAILYPFGTGRVTITVAENSQPYLVDLISQIGKLAFYVFLFGCFIVGAMISKGIKKKKYRPIFTTTFIFFIIGILFSRVSASSILNGETFISKALFFISFLALTISTIYIYLKSDWEIEAKWIFIVAWMIPMLLAVRSAVRLFFAIVPFISLMIPLALFETVKWGRKQKDDLIKLGSIILVVILGILIIISMTGYYKTIKTQAAYQTPSYNSDWQKAMGWVRNNTAEDSLFLHWWDYGYWVQTGGNRQTIVDGGYHDDYLVHPIGRYVLTTPYPETAKSYMKTYDVDYLLIDPSDIGKYGAYSSIGDDSEVSDRSSYIVTFQSNPSEIQETRNGTTRLYRGGIYLDTDINYKEENQNIFLPEGKAAIGGIILQTSNSNAVAQPTGIYIYNNDQYELPIRYAYVNGELIDFGSGINATAYIYPLVYTSSGMQKVDQLGAAMYLSEKTKDSLVVKLYLMDDPDNEYEELELAHEQSDYPFAFYYGGYQGAIKIYKVNTDEMTNIVTHEEFINRWPSNDQKMYGAFDNLTFTTD